MTEWEIVKESKQAWELLYDLHDNCEIASNNDRDNMDRCMNSLSNTYSSAWEKMSKNTNDCELLKTNIKCPHCGSDLYISDIVSYAYLCSKCDENMYVMECEVDKVWWNE